MKPVATEQKLRGGYYTPDPIGEFLATWAIRTPTDSVLEPSCGDGALIRAAARVLLAKGASGRKVATQIQAIEFEAAEADKARKSLRTLGLPASPAVVQTGDFFQYAARLIPIQTDLFQSDKEPKRTFDVVIGNPPFIRYQNFQEEHRETAFRLMNSMGLRPNRMTNAWVPFVTISAKLLKPHGRLAMVIPAELLQVTYTAELRKFLSEHFCRIMLVTFKQLVFPIFSRRLSFFVQKTMAELGRGLTWLNLAALKTFAFIAMTLPIPGSFKPMDHSAEKWTQYFLTKREIGLVRALRHHKKLQALGTLASVDVGVVTGLNEYFVLSDEAKKIARLNGYTRRIVARSGHMRGINFADQDWIRLSQESHPTYLLDMPKQTTEDLPATLQDYIRQGEAKDFHKGYKCRIRKLWYIVPSVYNPDAFMLRQIHRYPKIVLNGAGATCTDTIHRVRLLNGTEGRQLAAGSLNSVTFGFAEIVGRSYGGGVLELEPREAEMLPIPYEAAAKLDFEKLHTLMVGDDVDGVLDVTDRVLLKDWLGLNERETKMMRGIWVKLRDRRLNRKFKKTVPKA